VGPHASLFTQYPVAVLLDPVIDYHRQAAPCARIKQLVTCRSQ
jgi:hypothetical protein